MPRLRIAAACAAALLSLAPTRLAAIQLNPVATGLSSPLFVGNAGDGSNRLFIEEQGGLIRVLQPGSSTPTTFLDIHTKVVAGGEQGLLGLAFHPQYAGNGRFFVYYTRAGDGTIVIAEYHVSTTNRDVADPTETLLLTIPHPTNTNHNGGMMAFGSDGYLYIGVGDGGSANDPPNNAQNKDVLLGKILRIDINPPAGSGVPYLSPATNPFFGATPGRDEIFAYGMRNPWRFSFDRNTHLQWVGDVGQDASEEVDTPIAVGGNYGWRVFEGMLCTNNDTALCSSPKNYIFPIFSYAHTLGRCSITGGYVYRGSQGALPAGTYVYADYCTGEIFAWNGSSQSLLLDTAMNISSFGQDEAGELYVVGLGGTVSKIVSSTPCTYSINPTSASVGQAGGTGSVTVTAGATCAWTATSNSPWITITAGSSGSGNGTVNYSVATYTGRPKKRSGTMTIAGKTFTVKQTR
jgi:glucose/arabinose dehydrogenase